MKIMPDGVLQARDLVPPLIEGESVIGTVVIYNKTKGFGLIKIRHQPNDVYFRKEIVPTALQQTYLLGHTVQFIITLTGGRLSAESMENCWKNEIPSARAWFE